MHSLQASKNENFMNYKFQFFIIACQLIEYLFKSVFPEREPEPFFYHLFKIGQVPIP